MLHILYGDYNYHQDFLIIFTLNAGIDNLFDYVTKTTSFLFEYFTRENIFRRNKVGTLRDSEIEICFIQNKGVHLPQILKKSDYMKKKY